MEKIRIEHDDDALNIVAKINEALEKRGLVLKDDEKEHDGFMLFELLPLTAE